MTTPRIEELVEEFENIFVYDEELSEELERPIGSEPSFRKEVKAEHMGDVLRLVREGKDWLRKDWLRQALTEAHELGKKAGIDEAVEIFNNQIWVVPVEAGKAVAFAESRHDGIKILGSDLVPTDYPDRLMYGDIPLKDYMEKRRKALQDNK